MLSGSSGEAGAVKMRLHERISLLFTGAAYTIAGVLILIRPRFFYYWIAGVFFIQGVVSFIRALAKIRDKS